VCCALEMRVGINEANLRPNLKGYVLIFAPHGTEVVSTKAYKHNEHNS
jgi:hypothetical protein